jgi:hypothetical protein
MTLRFSHLRCSLHCGRSDHDSYLVGPEELFKGSLECNENVYEVST